MDDPEVMGRLLERERELGALRQTMHEVRRMAEMSAEIMRDRRRTGSWEGAERVAKQFDRIAKRCAVNEEDSREGT